jgi:hypothetical protein
MFRGDDQDAVGAGQLVFEAHHLRWQIGFMVLIEHRQIVDAREARIEFAGTKPDQRFGQLAVNGRFAIAADDHGNARQRRRITG